MISVLINCVGKVSVLSKAVIYVVLSLASNDGSNFISQFMLQMLELLSMRARKAAKHRPDSNLA